MSKKANVQTTKNAVEKPTTLAQLDKQMKDAAKVLGEQKKVDVHIPKYLEKRLGKNVPVAINGAVIHVPVGEKVKIPEAMANLLNDSLSNLKL